MIPIPITSFSSDLFDVFEAQVKFGLDMYLKAKKIALYAYFVFLDLEVYTSRADVSLSYFYKLIK